MQHLVHSPIHNYQHFKQHTMQHFCCCIVWTWDPNKEFSFVVIHNTYSCFPHSWFDSLGRWELPFYNVISADHSAPLCFIPTGILINKYPLQSDTMPSQQNKSSVSNVSTAGIKAHGGISQSEASRQLIFPLWLAKLCCSYTNGNGMCMSVPLSLPSLSHLSRQ